MELTGYVCSKEIKTAEYTKVLSFFGLLEAMLIVYIIVSLIHTNLDD